MNLGLQYSRIKLYYIFQYYCQFLDFSLTSTLSSLLSSYTQCWFRSQPGFWPQAAQLTSPSSLPATISTLIPTRAPSWSATSARRAPTCPSTAPRQPWGSAAPVLKVPSPGVRTVSSNAIAVGRRVLQASLRKRPAQPPKTASAHVPPTASCRGMVAQSVSPTHCALQGPGWKSGAVKQRTCSVSRAPRGLSRTWSRVRWSAEPTQTAKLRGWCCLHQGLEIQIMSVDPLLQPPLRLSPQPPHWCLHRVRLCKNPCRPHPLHHHHWLDLHTKVRACTLFLLRYVQMSSFEHFCIYSEYVNYCEYLFHMGFLISLISNSGVISPDDLMKWLN